MEAGGNGESKRVWTERLEIHSSNFELIKGLKRLRQGFIFKGTEREREREKKRKVTTESGRDVSVPEMCFKTEKVRFKKKKTR